MSLTKVTNAMIAFDGGSLSSRNRIINGNFNVNQRGVSGTVTLAEGNEPEPADATPVADIQGEQ